MQPGESCRGFPALLPLTTSVKSIHMWNSARLGEITRLHWFNNRLRPNCLLVHYPWWINIESAAPGCHQYAAAASVILQVENERVAILADYWYRLIKSTLRQSSRVLEIAVVVLADTNLISLGHLPSASVQSLAQSGVSQQPANWLSATVTPIGNWAGELSLQHTPDLDCWGGAHCLHSTHNTTPTYGLAAECPKLLLNQGPWQPWWTIASRLLCSHKIRCTDSQMGK